MERPSNSEPQRCARDHSCGKELSTIRIKSSRNSPLFSIKSSHERYKISYLRKTFWEFGGYHTRLNKWHPPIFRRFRRNGGLPRSFSSNNIRTHLRNYEQSWKTCRNFPDFLLGENRTRGRRFKHPRCRIIQPNNYRDL